MPEQSKKTPPKRKAAAKKPSLRPRKPKPKTLTQQEQLQQEIELLDEDFEYALLESCQIEFPITDPNRKLTKYQEQLQRIARNKRIHELAIGGATVRQISSRMTATGWAGASRSNVSKVLQKSLAISSADADMTANMRKRLELDKIEQAELQHFGPFLNEKDADSAEKRSRVMERIWKRRDVLEGRSQKVEVTGEGGGPINTVTRVILPPEAELPDDDA